MPHVQTERSKGQNILCKAEITPVTRHNVIYCKHIILVTIAHLPISVIRFAKCNVPVVMVHFLGDRISIELVSNENTTVIE